MALSILRPSCTHHEQTAISIVKIHQRTQSDVSDIPDAIEAQSCDRDPFKWPTAHNPEDAELIVKNSMPLGLSTILNPDLHLIANPGKDRMPI